MIAELQNQVFQFLYAIFDQFGWLGVAALMAFENTTGATPSDLILGMAGWLLLAKHDAAPVMILVGGLYAAIGSVVGASSAYWVVRVGGRPLVDRVLGLLRVNHAVVPRVEAQFRRWGPGLVLVGRLIPGIRILITIPAALARMPFVQFALYTFLGTYIWSTVLIGVGYTVGHEWPRLVQALQPSVPSILIVTVLLAVAGLLAGVFLLPRWRAKPAPVISQDDDRT